MGMANILIIWPKSHEQTYIALSDRALHVILFQSAQQFIGEDKKNWIRGIQNKGQ